MASKMIRATVQRRIVAWPLQQKEFISTQRIASHGSFPLRVPDYTLLVIESGQRGTSMNHKIDGSAQISGDRTHVMSVRITLGDILTVAGMVTLSIFEIILLC